MNSGMIGPISNHTVGQLALTVPQLPCTDPQFYVFF